MLKPPPPPNALNGVAPVAPKLPELASEVGLTIPNGDTEAMVADEAVLLPIDVGTVVVLALAEDAELNAPNGDTAVVLADDWEVPLAFEGDVKAPKLAKLLVPPDVEACELLLVKGTPNKEVELTAAPFSVCDSLSSPPKLN